MRFIENGKIMLGTIVNVCTIVAGSIIGALVKRGIGERFTQSLYNALGLCSLALGFNACVRSMSQSVYPVLFILSLAIGGCIGTWLDLDERVTQRVARVSGSELAKGITTASLLYCIGTLSMVGPINSALMNDHTYLFTNATLDFVTSLVLAASYGIGVIAAAGILFCWQGGIYCLALYARPFLSDALLAETSLVGGVLIVSTGLSLLNIKNCHTLNLLPSLFVPAAYFLLKMVLPFLP